MKRMIVERYESSNSILYRNIQVIYRNIQFSSHMMFDRSVLEFDQSETSISEGHAKVKKCITICVFDIITQCTNFSSTVFKQLFL